ncbi:MAG: hypothetical protein ACM31C_20545 [Acidobacteriota bacterium]
MLLAPFVPHPRLAARPPGVWPGRCGRCSDGAAALEAVPGAVLALVRDAELASARVDTRDARHELVAAAVAIAMVSGTLDELERVSIAVDGRAFDVMPRFDGPPLVGDDPLDPRPVT